MDRVIRAVEKVQKRVQRTAAILDRAGIPYAIVGGNAVGYWVAQVRESAVRFTRDVDVLIARSDLEAVQMAMEVGGFKYRHVARIDCFLDGPESSFEDAVHVIFASEKVHENDLSPAADVTDSVPGNGFRVLSLEPLVRMKLTAFRIKDQTHLDDLLQIGLIDSSWKERFSPELQIRYQQILDQFEPHLGNDHDFTGVSES